MSDLIGCMSNLIGCMSDLIGAPRLFLSFNSLISLFSFPINIPMSVGEIRGPYNETKKCFFSSSSLL